MSEREFEAYLSLLGGLLNLNSNQRKEIAEELRTHLDERLDDLIASGLSREEAVQSSLEEFGDAAGLAAHFTHLTSLTRRRRIMRWTTGTVAVMTVCILSLAHFWPVDNARIDLIVSQSDAQQEIPANQLTPRPDTTLVDDVEPPPPTGLIDAASPEVRIEKKLSEPLKSVDYIEMPFEEVLAYLSDLLELDFVIDRAALDEVGLDTDSYFTLTLNYGKISTKTLLGLMFEQLGVKGELTYTIRDEIIYITGISNSMSIRVYDCRDMIDPKKAPSGSGMDDMGMGVGMADDMMMMGGSGAGMTEVQFGGGGSGFGGEGAMGMEAFGGMGGGMMSAGPAQHSPAGQLIEVIEQTVTPEIWANQGGQGSIQSFNGLLIIKATEETHRAVTDLLEQMRDVVKKGVPGKTKPEKKQIPPRTFDDPDEGVFEQGSTNRS